MGVINDFDKDYLIAFGQHLKKVRTEKGFSQESLGLDAGLGKNQVGLLELGRINVTLATIKRLADALKTEPKELLNF